MTDYEDALKKSSLGDPVAEALIESIDATRVDAVRFRLSQDAKAELNTTQRAEEDGISALAEFGRQAATRARGEDASILRSRQRGSALIKIKLSSLASAMPEHYVAAAHLVELMAMSAHGDHAAFAELYDLTSRRIHGVVLGCCAPPSMPRK